MKSSRPLCVFCWIATSALVALCLSALHARGAETLPEGLKVVAIEARPASIELKHKFDYRQLLLTGKLATGESVDLTRMAQLAAPAKVVSVSPTGQVRAVADGNEQLSFSYDGISVNVPVAVTGSGTAQEISFIRDVQPAFSRMGCNAGTCHGSKEGKNGFKLSLRGYDGLYDYRAFTDDVAARRFNRAAPDQSLMLLKASGSVPHVGGVRTKVGEPYYELVRAWIAAGVKFDPNSPRVAKIEVFPQDPIVPRIGMKQQMVVMATYTDGTTRDVTREAFVESGNIEVIEAAEGGIVTMLRRGEAPVLVRYEGAYAATTLIVMGDRSGFEWQQQPTNNYIDELAYKKLQRVKILPSGICTDEEFIRRVNIDLTGLPPKAEAVKAFLADKRDSKVKRDELVDQLVGSRDYVEHWTNKWADLLQVNRKFLGEEGSVALRNWIKANLASNKPYDQFAREVITASGSNVENPPASYYKTLREPDMLMENTTHLFLAVRFNCNKCHDHPFERWTQDQYYHLASYFAQVGRKEDPSFTGQKIGGSAVEGAVPLAEVVYDTGAGEVKHERTGQVAPPSFPYAHADVAPATASRREQLAHWITSKDNQYFAKSYVNRQWGYLFGTGIIEPIDDIRAGNPATNPELLDALAADFIKSGFDMQHVLRTICKSRVYQHSVSVNKWNADDTVNYSHSIPRRLPAETLFDAIHAATGSIPRIPGAPAGFRAAELPDAGVSLPFLEDFGRPVRESSCECERSSGMVLGPIMKLVNGPTVADAIADPASELTKLVASQPDDAKLLDEVFVRFLARYPSDAERKLGAEAMQAAGMGHEELVALLAEYEKQIPAKQAAWETSLGSVVSWTVLEPSEMKSLVGGTFTKQEDKSIVVSGPTGKEAYTLTIPTDLKGITAFKLEALPDKALPTSGPGRAPNGNFVLSELELTAAPKADPAKSAAIGLQNASATFSQEQWLVANAIDGNPATGWAVSPKFGEAHTAIFETKADIGVDGGTLLTIKMVQEFPDTMHLLGKFRISATTAKRPVDMNRVPPELAKLLAVPSDQRTPEQKAALLAEYKKTDGELARLQSAVQQSAEQLKNARLVGIQDLAWALINNPAFLFNR